MGEKLSQRLLLLPFILFGLVETGYARNGALRATNCAALLAQANESRAAFQERAKNGNLRWVLAVMGDARLSDFLRSELYSAALEEQPKWIWPILKHFLSTSHAELFLRHERTSKAIRDLALTTETGKQGVVMPAELRSMGQPEMIAFTRHLILNFPELAPQIISKAPISPANKRALALKLSAEEPSLIFTLSLPLQNIEPSLIVRGALDVLAEPKTPDPAIHQMLLKVAKSALSPEQKLQILDAAIEETPSRLTYAPHFTDDGAEILSRLIRAVEASTDLDESIDLICRMKPRLSDAQYQRALVMFFTAEWSIAIPATKLRTLLPASRHSSIIALSYWIQHLTQETDDWNWEDVQPNLQAASPYLDNKFQLTAEEGYRVLSRVIETATPAFLRSERLELLLKDWYGSFQSAMMNRREYFAALLRRDPLGTLGKFFGAASFEELPLNAPLETPSLVQWLELQAQRHPDLIPRGIPSRLAVEVENRHTFLRLLSFAASKSALHESAENVVPHFVSQMGLDGEALSRAGSLRNSTTLELLLDIQDAVPFPPFAQWRIETEAFSDGALFTQFLRILRDLLFFQHGDSDAWNTLVRENSLSELPITRERLRELTKVLQEKLVSLVITRFQKSSVTLSYEDFIRLQEEWGDLEPIWTLVSRFESKAKWHREINILARVFQHSLKGTFERYKFEGEASTRNSVAQATAQMSPIRAQGKREAWRRPRTRVSLMGAIAPANEARQPALPAEQFREVARNTLFVHAQFSASLPRIPESARGWAETLGPAPDDAIALEDPSVLIDQWELDWTNLELGPEDRAAMAKFQFHRILHVLDEQDETEVLKRYTRLLKVLLVRYPLCVSARQLQQVHSDLKALAAVVEPIERSKAQGLVLTVLNSDPKFLLTIGDLVKTTSCQNYRTGSHIETLLGYVIDANVRAMASFVVKEAHFETGAQFHQVLRAFASHSPVEVHFDGNQRRASFQLENETIVTKPLGNAYLRQMLKLGKGARSGKASIRLEKRYFQQHDSLSQMQQQHNDLLNEVAAEIGATKSGEAVLIPKSRNPEGVYSDLKPGVHTTPYELPAD